MKIRRLIVRKMKIRCLTRKFFCWIDLSLSFSLSLVLVKRAMYFKKTLLMS